MLKLLKYEWKACARTCLPLYGVLILMSLISRILYVIPKNASLDFMLPAISSMLYMGVMMAAFVVTAVILIQRFYKNLLGSEGYLMFTLPVTVTGVDQDPELARHFGVMSIPTVVFLKGGREIARKVGVMPEAIYDGLIQENL